MTSTSPALIQCGKEYLAGVISNIGVFCLGTAMGWMNSGGYAAPEEGYSHGPPVDEWQLTDVMLPLGAACFCMPMGMLINRYGCKTIMLLQLVPYCVGWVMLICASSVYMVYVARYLLGISGAALCIAVPIYNAEIARMHNRGSMGSLFYGALVYGIVFNNVLADLVGIQIANIVCLLMALFYSLVKFIPETPSHLFRRGRSEEARATMHWLRGNHYDSSAELKELRQAARNSDAKLGMNPCGPIRHKRNLRSWPRSAMMLLLYQISGGVIISSHLRNMLESFGVRFAIYMYCVHLSLCLGYSICFLLVDRLGRRPILLLSSVFMCICSLNLWIWFMWLESITWQCLPMISFVLFIGFFSMGFGPLCWILYVEVLSEPVRPYGCAFAATICWAVASILNIKLHPNYSPSHSTTFLSIFIVCALGLLFVLIFIPETKNLTSARIQSVLAIGTYSESHSSEESV